MIDPKKLLSKTELEEYRISGDLMGSISEQTGEAICRELEIEMMTAIPVPSAEENRELQELIPPEIGLRLGIVPWSCTKNEDDELVNLKVATNKPLDGLPITIIGQMYPFVQIDIAYVSQNTMVNALQQLYGIGGDLIVGMMATGEYDEDLFSYKEELNVIDPDDDEATSINYVNQILADAVRRRATDIHVEPQPEALQVRYRIDGMLRNIPVPSDISAIQDSIIARIKIMAGLDTAIRRKPQDGRIAIEVESLRMDTRVATIPSIEGESIVIRILGQRKFNMDSLELTDQFRSHVEELLKIPHGIILVTGPTGCGKSTSLFSFLQAISNEVLKIITIEDPVEHKLDDATQIAVDSNQGLTFASILRSVLRTDPNVIMVGEMRDSETAQIAVQAALTGHLVFSTLHTNDSVSGITRLIDLGVEPFLVSNAVRAILAQRLVKRLCSQCKIQKDYQDDYLDSIGFPQHPRDTIFTRNPSGCERCEGTGFYDRIGIYEIFPLSSEIQELIVAGKPKHDLRIQAKDEGFLSMRQYGFLKVIEGVTSIDEVLMVTEM